MALLEEAKNENMGSFISQMRRELDELWEKCYVGEEEKEGFSPYVSGQWKALVHVMHAVVSVSSFTLPLVS